jgi:hypothetical protein
MRAREHDDGACALLACKIIPRRRIVFLACSVQIKQGFWRENLSRGSFTGWTEMQILEPDPTKYTTVHAVDGVALSLERQS